MGKSHLISIQTLQLIIFDTIWRFIFLPSGDIILTKALDYEDQKLFVFNLTASDDFYVCIRRRGLQFHMRIISAIIL